MTTEQATCSHCAHHGPYAGQTAPERCTVIVRGSDGDVCGCTDAVHTTLTNPHACELCGRLYEWGGKSSECFSCYYQGVYEQGERDAAPMIATLREAHIDASIDHTGGGCMSVAFDVEGVHVWVSGIDPAVGGGASLWYPGADDGNIIVIPSEPFGGDEDYEQWHAEDGELQRRWARYVIANVGAWVVGGLPLAEAMRTGDTDTNARVTLANGDVIEVC